MVSGIIHGSVQAANDKQVYCGSLAIRLMRLHVLAADFGPFHGRAGRVEPIAYEDFKH